MKEYIKLFPTPESGNNYSIYDIPWISTVRTTRQNLSWDTPGYSTKNKNGVLVIGDPSVFHFSAQEVNIMDAIITEELVSGLTSQYGILTSVEFGNNVTSIGNNAFYNQYCSGLTSVTFSDTVNSIGDNAFRGCTNLIHVTLPNDLSNIGEGAFRDCSKLLTINLPNGITALPNYIFSGCTSLSTTPMSVYIRSIGNGTFAGCTGLGYITFGGRVSSIGEMAFCGCTNLEYVEIPDNVTGINPSAFADCYNIKTVTIGEGITYIDSNAFSGCDGIEYIIIDSINPPYINTNSFGSTGNTFPIYVPYDGLYDYQSQFSMYNYHNRVQPNIPENEIWYTSTDGSIVTPNNLNYTDNEYIDGKGVLRCSYTIDEIYANAFDGCNTLQTISLPLTVTAIGEYAFNNCVELTEIKIPYGLNIIGDYAFNGCEKLVAIRIPNSVVEICAYAFYGCIGLHYVKMSNNIEHIYERAFANCGDLRSIDIPESMVSIGGFIVENCPLLGDINIYTDQIGTFGEAFEGVGSQYSFPIIYGTNHNLDTLMNIFAGTTYDGKVFEKISNNQLYYITNDYGQVDPSDGDYDSNIYYNYLGIIQYANTLTSIPDLYFAEKDTLVYIKIPNTVTEIGTGAFLGCANLVNMFYDGTVDEWNQITLGGDWSASTSLEMVQCTDGYMSLS